MPTTITAQDGAVIEQDTHITPDGCSGVLSNKTSNPTRAQQLAKALKACRRKYHAKKAKGRRVSCERRARKHYDPVKHKKTHGKAKKAARAQRVGVVASRAADRRDHG